MVRRIIIAVLLVALLSSCTGSAGEATASAAAEAAGANVALLDFTDDLATTEMLDVRTGDVAALDDVVTGDRAVLLWYWAPD